jgi:CRISPR-associated protein Csx17
MPNPLHKIVLGGCTPEPLSHYLKGLGILRILTEQEKDPHCSIYWQNEQLILISQLTPDELQHFLLWDYQPSYELSNYHLGMAVPDFILKISRGAC